MAKKSELKERGTGDVLYPVTSQECILTRDGSGVPSNKETEQKLAELVDSTPDYLSVLNSLKERLSKNPDEAAALTKEIADSKRALFIDLWNDACGGYGKYNAETGYFELNGITDLEYDEAKRIYNLKCRPNYAGDNTVGLLSRNLKVRTFFPINYMYGATALNLSCFCQINGSLEVIRIEDDAVNHTVNNINYSFYQCFKLKSILGVIRFTNTVATGSAFSYCRALQDIKINGLRNNISFPDSSKLSYDSLQYLIMYAVAQSNSITVTVHPDIYNALQGEADEYPFNGGTQEEWQQLLQDATAKNIQFATA